MQRGRNLLACLLFAMPSLAFGQSVEGTVTDALTHVALAGATVSLEIANTKDKFISKTATDPQGYYSFRDLRSGAYTLSVHARGYASPAHDDVSRQPFTISAVTGATRRDVVLMPAAALSGHVFTPGKQPVPGATVLLSNRNIDGTVDTTTGPDGSFVFTDVVPGQYLLVAQAPATLPSPDTAEADSLVWTPTYYPGFIDRNAAAPLLLVAGATLSGHDLVLQTTPTHHVRGVVLANGQPVPPGTTVKASSREPFLPGQSPRELITRCAADGVFDLAKVPDGTWRLSAEAKAEGGIIWRGFQEEVLLGRDLDLVQIPLRPPFTWTGSAILEGPGPTSAGDASSALLKERVGVFLFPETGGNEALRTAVSDAQSHFAFSQIYADTYRIYGIRLKAPYYLDSVRVGDQDVLGSPVRVEPNSSPFILVYRADGGVVRGALEDGPGASALVVLMPVEDRLRIPLLLDWTTAQPDGSFTFSAVRPGEYYAVAIPATASRPDTIVRQFSQLYLPSAVRVKVGRGESVSVAGVHQFKTFP